MRGKIILTESDYQKVEKHLSEGWSFPSVSGIIKVQPVTLGRLIKRDERLRLMHAKYYANAPLKAQCARLNTTTQSIKT